MLRKKTYKDINKAHLIYKTMLMARFPITTDYMPPEIVLPAAVNTYVNAISNIS